MHFLVMACLFVGCAMTACSDDDDTDDVIPSDDTSYVGKSVGNFTAEEWYVGGLKGTTMNRPKLPFRLPMARAIRS